MKRHSKYHAFPAALALLATSFSTHAATVFTDTFASGTGAWYKGGTLGTLANTGNALVWTENGNSMDETIARSFTAQTIGVGQTIRLTFDYSQNGSTTNNIIRAGLYNVTNTVAADNWANSNAVGAWTGYGSFVRDASGSGNIARVENAASTSNTVGPTLGATSTFTTITSPANTTNFNINDNGTVTYQALFEITRTLTGMTTLFTLSSGVTTHFSVTGTTSTVYDTFDTVVFKQAGTTAMPVTYDNIQVSVIPEPSAALLGAFGVLTLLRRRRI